MSKQIYNVVSLFSGCGGMDAGFVQAGFKIIWANDSSKYACETYINYFKGNFINKEIELISSDEIPKCEVILGGFPCQGFSLAGKKQIDDSRNRLYLEMKRIVNDLKPLCFVAENVRGLMSMYEGKVYEKVLHDFNTIGYDTKGYLLDAVDFGVPQRRERVFIIGFKWDFRDLRFKPTHREPLKKQKLLMEEELPYYRTVRDAIGHLGELGTSPNHEIKRNWPEKYDSILKHIKQGQRLYNHRNDKKTVVHTWDIPEVYGETTSKERQLLITLMKNRRKKKYKEKGFVDGSPLSIDLLEILSGLKDAGAIMEGLIKKGYLQERVTRKYDFKDGTYNRFQRLHWDKPSRTILTNSGNIRDMVHPEENRPLSVRECALIQTLPNDMIFYGPLDEQYRQIGNAVPTLLAKNIANKIKNVLESDGSKLSGKSKENLRKTNLLDFL